MRVSEVLLNKIPAKSAKETARALKAVRFLFQLKIHWLSGGGIFRNPHLEFSRFHEPFTGGVEVAEFLI
jgi:hypothetical protein